MASSLCKSAVLKVYHEIMDDVVAGIREVFLEDGVDEQILQELKQSWETKLLATKAVDTQSEIDKQIAMVKKETTSNGQVFNHKNHPQQQHAQAGVGASHGQQLLPTASSLAAPVSTVRSTTAPPPPTSATGATTAVAGRSQPAHQPLPPAPPKQEPADAMGQQPAPALALHVSESAKQVPIQITLPQQPGNDGPRVLTIQVPVSALQGNQLHKVLTGPVITATMGLPHAIASTLLQQHVNAAFSQQRPLASGASASAPPTGNGLAPASVAAAAAAQTNASGAKSLAQGDAAHDDSDDDQPCPSDSDGGGRGANGPASASPRSPDRQRAFHTSRNRAARMLAKAEAVLASVLGGLSMRPFVIDQNDGNLMDTSDEDDEPSDEEEASDEDYDNKDEEDQEMEDAGPEEEPLNSEDDVTDEDPSELFDTDNVVVCQYDKITRARNKWKFHLKDGIMNLNGEDYVFQKASGDAEW